MLAPHNPEESRTEKFRMWNDTNNKFCTMMPSLECQNMRKHCVGDDAHQKDIAKIDDNPTEVFPPPNKKNKKKNNELVDKYKTEQEAEFVEDIKWAKEEASKLKGLPVPKDPNKKAEHNAIKGRPKNWKRSAKFSKNIWKMMIK